MSHPNSHGGHATAAKRRDETYVACGTCGVVSRSYTDEPETVSDVFWAFLTFAFLMVAFFVFVHVAAAL